MVQFLLRGDALALVLTTSTGLAAAQSPPRSGDGQAEPAPPGRLQTEAALNKAAI